MRRLVLSVMASLLVVFGLGLFISPASPQLKNTSGVPKGSTVDVLVCFNQEAYDRHANCYVNKPIDFDQFINVVRSIENFWLSIVKLPAA